MAELVAPGGRTFTELTPEAEVTATGATITLTNARDKVKAEVKLGKTEVEGLVKALEPALAAKKMIGLGGLITYDKPFTNTTIQQILAAKKELGDEWDRWDSSYEPVSDLEEAVAQGFNCVVLYKPATGEKGVPLSQVSAELVERRELMLRLKQKYVEVFNEPYNEDVTAEEYAAVLKVALEVFEGTGIVVLQKYWGDYPVPGTPGPEWSQGEAGRGWYVDTTNALKALGCEPITNVAVHPYGPLTGTHIWGSGLPSGWGSFATARQLTPGLTYFVTEVGQEAVAGDTAAEQAQAEAMTAYVKDTCESDDIAMLLIFTALEEGSEPFGIYKEAPERKLGEPKQAAKALAAAIKEYAT